MNAQDAKQRVLELLEDEGKNLICLLYVMKNLNMINAEVVNVSYAR